MARVRLQLPPTVEYRGLTDANDPLEIRLSSSVFRAEVRADRPASIGLKDKVCLIRIPITSGKLPACSRRWNAASGRVFAHYRKPGNLGHCLPRPVRLKSRCSTRQSRVSIHATTQSGVRCAHARTRSRQRTPSMSSAAKYNPNIGKLGLDVAKLWPERDVIGRTGHKVDTLGLGISGASGRSWFGVPSFRGARKSGLARDDMRLPAFLRHAVVVAAVRSDPSCASEIR